MIQKFKSFEEARRALWNFNPDKEYYEKVDKFFELAFKLVKTKEKPGIKKFRTLEEFNKYKENLRKEGEE